MSGMYTNKGGCVQDPLYTRLDTVTESDVSAELEVGAANLTAPEASMDTLSIERANDMKGGSGIKYEGVAENVTESSRYFSCIL